MLIKKAFSKKLSFILFGFLIMSSSLVYGQTLINETLRSGSLPAGWNQSNISFETAAGGYARFDETSSVLTTPTFNASANASIDIEFDVAKWGTGGDGPVTVEYSLDSGTTWTMQGNSTTPTSGTYQSNAISVNTTSATMQIRFTRASSPSRKRLRDVVIVGVGGGGSCSITDISIINPGTCNDNGTPADSNDDYYLADIEVTYSNPPASGSIDLTGVGVVGGNVSDIIGSSVQTISGVQLKADGNDVEITASFSADPTCNYTEIVSGSGVASCSSSGGGSCLNESFGNISPFSSNTYLTRTWVGDDGYTFTATDSRSDQNINGDAILVRNGSLEVNNVTGGIGDLTLTTQRIFSGGSGALDVFVNGSLVGTIPYDASVQTSTITGINISGVIDVEIVSSNSDRIAMDDLQWTCFSTSNTVTTSNVSPLTFNVNCSSGENGDVDFTSSGVFNAGNNFIAQLSDETGNFANPVNIGSLTLAGSNPSGNISFTIPLATISGTGYRIRVISDDPNAIGSDNGVDITVSLSGGPCVLEPPHMTSLIINSCNSSCSEGNNEVVFGFTGDYSVLMNSANLELTYGNSPSPTTVYTNPLVNNSGTTDDLNSEAGCAGLFVDATNTVIPPNSSFMLAHDEFCPGDVLDFANLCGSGPIYVVYTEDPSWSLSGNFVNDPGCSGGTRYLTTSIVSTDGSSHIIDYEFDCTLNTGSNGDYAKWDANGGTAIEQGNNGCELDPIVLPIELLELKAYKKKDEVEIKWSTLSERSNDYFILSHSTDGLNFFTISTFDGAGTSTNTNYYSDIHLYPKEGINYYRLQSVDYDGTTYLKGIRAVEFNSENIYYDNFSRMIYTNSKGDYNVVNLAGQIIIKGRDTDKIPFSNTGIYIIQNLKTGETNKLAIH